MVSFSMTAGAAAENSDAQRIVLSMSSGVTSGRAPSWMAASLVPGRTSIRPESTDSDRLFPPFTTLVTFVISNSAQRWEYSTISSSRATMMISQISGHAYKSE